MKNIVRSIVISSLLAVSVSASAQSSKTQDNDKQTLRDATLKNRKVVRDAKADMREFQREQRKAAK